MSGQYSIGQRVWVNWAQAWGEVVSILGDGVYTVRIIRPGESEERADTTAVYLSSESEKGVESIHAG